jgi:hypothetical protein
VGEKQEIKAKSPQKRHATLAQDGIIKDDFTGDACHALADMQRQQVFFARVAVAGSGGFIPFEQAQFTFILG